MCFNVVLHLFRLTYFLMYLSFSLAVYEGTVRIRFSIVLCYYSFNYFCIFSA